MNPKDYIAKIVLGLTFLTQSLTLLSQNPTHYFLGKEELASSDIYSLKQNRNGELFIATNYGLYKYEYGVFNKIEWDCEHQGSSLFSLRLNSKGDLYGINLSGEVFLLEDNKLKKYLSVPKEYVSPEGIDMAFDSDDQLILRSKGYYLYKEEKWTNLLKNEQSLGKTMNFYDPETVLIPSSSNSELYAVSNNGLVIQEQSQSENMDIYAPERRYAFFHGQSLHSIDDKGLIISYNNSIKYKIHDEHYALVQQTNKNQVWALDKTSGAFCLSLTNEGVQTSNKIFEDILISAVDESEDGTVFLGTFGKGVIVIPSINSRIYETELAQINHFVHLKNKQQIQKVDFSNFQRIQLSNDEQIIYDMDGLFFEENVNFNLNDDHINLLFQLQRNANYSERKKTEIGFFGTIKHCVKVDSTTALIASSAGIFKVGPGLSHLSWLKNGGGENWYRLKEKLFRSRSVNYLPLSKELLYSKQSGLFLIDSLGIEKEILNEGNSVNSTYITVNERSFICATQDKGILFIRDGEIFVQIDKSNGLKSGFVQKVELVKNELYIATKEGFQIYNLENEKWNNLGKYSRIINGAVNDFIIASDEIWLASGNKLISIPISESTEDVDFDFSLKNIILRNQIFSKTDDLTTPYNHSKVVIGLNFNGIPFEEDARIEYRLNEGNWVSLKATTEKLEFPSFAPGEYELKFRVNYLGEYSHETSLAFKVTPPYWQTWWFFSLTIFLIVGGVFISLRIRVKRQQRRQQLVTDKLESELKALRSQMNPHFIFNSLNSIQDLVMREDTRKTYDYIVLFSKLVRSTLNYSSLDFIPIEKEVEFLNVYLSLEKLRFQDDFDYEISYEGCEDYAVPSLLIQPFLENALVHGLLHKKGKKN